MLPSIYCQYSPDGWGASTQSTSTWAPAATKEEDTSAVPSANGGGAAPAIKREQASTALESGADGEETAVWFMERVCVQLKSGDQQAVIKEINSDKTAVVTLDDNSTKQVRVDEVTRVSPKEKDTVLVIGGADVGVEGELVCIDGSDAILKDSNEDFKIVDFVHLAKIGGES